MPLPIRTSAARLAPLWLLSAAVLCACDPVEDKAGAGNTRSYTAPVPPPRRAPRVEPANFQWMEAWQGVRGQLTALRSEFNEEQSIYRENNFDDLLTLDPDTLTKEQLCHLFHLLDRGYLRIEREALVKLLQRRVERAATMPATTGTNLRERIAAGMALDELSTVDAEIALSVYRRTGGGEKIIPESLTEDELADLRVTVRQMLIDEREKIAGLDALVAQLKALPADAPETAQ